MYCVRLQVFDVNSHTEDPLTLYSELEPDYANKDCQKAHALERFFGWIAGAKGKMFKWVSLKDGYPVYSLLEKGGSLLPKVVPATPSTGSTLPNGQPIPVAHAQEAAFPSNGGLPVPPAPAIKVTNKRVSVPDAVQPVLAALQPLADAVTSA